MEEQQEESEQDAKTVLVFAGPNGSGKSSVTAEFLRDPERPFQGTYINPDDIAKSLAPQIADARQRNIAAAVQAEQLRHTCLKRGESFAFETVMSTPEKVALMTQARVRGYEVNLVFVTTQDPAINIARIADRVAKGGHPVADDAVRSRYASAMRLLPVAIELADSAVVFDNSRTDEPALLVAQRFLRGHLEVETGDHVPSWVDQRLVKDYGARVASLAELATVLRQAGYVEPPPVSYAEAAHGLSYSGKVVGFTAHHVLQDVGKGGFLVHTRTLTQDRAYRIGETMAVSYAYDKGKVAQLRQERER